MGSNYKSGKIARCRRTLDASLATFLAPRCRCCPALPARCARIAAGVHVDLVFRHRRPAPGTPRRRTLRRDRARNGGYRRLGHAATEWPSSISRSPPLQYWITAAAFEAFGIRRLDRAAVARAGRMAWRAVHRLRRTAHRRPDARLVQRRCARRVACGGSRCPCAHARRRTQLVDERRHWAVPDCAARRRDSARTAALDAGRRGGAGARRCCPRA